MGASTTGVEPETNPEVERLLREVRSGRSASMPPRELRAEVAVGLAFAAAAVALLVRGPTAGWDPTAAAVLVLAYAAATRARFEIGGGSTDPTLLVLVPALFIEPPAVVPLLVAGGFALGRAVDVVHGELNPYRLLATLGNAWNAIGPALALTLAGAGRDPALRDWPTYLLAFAAYAAADTASGVTREWLARGVRPDLQLRMLGRVYALDALLAPVGLLAALADARDAYAFLLAVPLVVVLGILARERTTRLDHALSLSESRARLLEAELEVAQTRVEVLGALSHGLQTPLAGVVAISGVLVRRGADMPGEAVVQAATRLEDEAVALRQLVRQGLDYVGLVEGATLRLRPEEVDLAGVADEIAGRRGVPVRAVAGDGPPPRALADAARVHQILSALLARAGRQDAAPPAGVQVRRAGTRVVVSVDEGGPVLGEAELAALTAPPSGALGTLEHQGTGIDLYVAAELARAMGGSLVAAGAPGGTRWTLTLPAA